MSKTTQTRKAKKISREARNLAPAVMLVLPSRVMESACRSGPISNSPIFWSYWTSCAAHEDYRHYWTTVFVRAIMHLRDGRMPTAKLVDEVLTEIFNLRRKHL